MGELNILVEPQGLAALGDGLVQPTLVEQGRPKIDVRRIKILIEPDGLAVGFYILMDVTVDDSAPRDWSPAW